MTLLGLGTPLMPSLSEHPCPQYQNQPQRSQPPPSNLVIRPTTRLVSGRSSSSNTGKVPACFFKILHQVPTAIPVFCPEYSADSSRKSSDTTEDANPSTSNLLTNRQLLESRIKSLRLEIGDLSIAENLEKLCDHYFKLDDKNRIRSDEFNRKLSMLLNEKTRRESLAHEKGIKPSTVTFSLGESQGESFSSESRTSVHCSLFGQIFHGKLSKAETESRLQVEGEYLIRNISNEPAFILSFRCNGSIQNFRIFKDSEFSDLFYLEDRKVCYASLDEMVNEGLKTLFLDARAGRYIDALTELAQINKHDSMISPVQLLLPSTSTGVSPSSPRPGSISTSRKSSYVGVTLTGSGMRRPSALPQLAQGQSHCQKGPESETESPDEIEEDSLLSHAFLPGNVNLDKKSPCDLESCPLRQKVSFCSRGGNANSNTLPSGKETFVCRDCGLTIHEKCQDRLTTSKFLPCLPDMYKIPEIFGSDLTTLVKAGMTMTMRLEEEGQGKGQCQAVRQRQLQGREPLPPFVVTKCVQEIERRGLGSEGIYRVPGSQDVVLKMQHLLERDRTNADLSPISDTDSLCGLLKMYLRQLPEPLISREVFAKIMQDANDNVPLTLTSTRSNLTQLPPAHKTTLRYLLTHFDRVIQERERNKMSAYNLAVVLVPSLIIPDEMTLFTIKIATDVVDLLLRNNSTFDFLK